MTRTPYSLNIRNIGIDRRKNVAVSFLSLPPLKRKHISHYNVNERAAFDTKRNIFDSNFNTAHNPPQIALLQRFHLLFQLYKLSRCFYYV